jgi:hypothetical protein
MIVSQTAFLSGLRKSNPSFAPATTTAYSNAAYEVLAFALEKITGKTFETMLELRVYQSTQSPLNKLGATEHHTGSNYSHQSNG